MHQLTLLPLGRTLPLPPGRTVWMAAREGGVRLPSSCRNGSCRACLARLQQGQVHYRIDWPGLLAEEKAEGWILPCVAHADSDLVLLAPGATELPGGPLAPSTTPASTPKEAP